MASAPPVKNKTELTDESSGPVQQRCLSFRTDDVILLRIFHESDSRYFLFLEQFHYSFGDNDSPSGTSKIPSIPIRDVKPAPFRYNPFPIFRCLVTSILRRLKIQSHPFHNINIKTIVAVQTVTVLVMSSIQ